MSKNMESVREVMRKLQIMGSSSGPVNKADLDVLAHKLRESVPLAPCDAIPGEFYALEFLGDPGSTFVGVRTNNGILTEEGEYHWSIISPRGVQTGADDDEIRLVSGRKLDTKGLQG